MSLDDGWTAILLHKTLDDWMTITKISPIMSPVHATLNFSRPITSGANHSTLRQESQKTNETKATVLACESFRSMSSISSCESEMPPDLRSSSRQKTTDPRKRTQHSAKHDTS